MYFGRSSALEGGEEVGGSRCWEEAILVGVSKKEWDYKTIQ